jgi:hypothetical protein
MLLLGHLVQFLPFWHLENVVLTKKRGGRSRRVVVARTISPE